MRQASVAAATQRSLVLGGVRGWAAAAATQAGDWGPHFPWSPVLAPPFFPASGATAAGISSATSGGFSSSGAGDDGSSAATCAGAGSAFSSSSGKPSAATGASAIDSKAALLLFF